MRRHGHLTRWNDDRGFGFITPSGGGADLFVHISAFPRDGVRPRPDELVSFEVDPGQDGKPRAIRVQRAGSAAPARRSAQAPEPATLRMGLMAETKPDARFQCDGRTHCSEMTSCEEARYFLQHCPGTELDGDGDGQPCERQHCD